MFFDLLVVSAFLVCCVFFGLRGLGRFTDFASFAQFKDLDTFWLVCSIVAGSLGYGSVVTVAGSIFSSGVSQFALCIILPLSMLSSACFIAPFISRFKDCLTLSDVMYQLYGNTGSLIATFMSLAKSLASLTIQAGALGLIFQYFFGTSLMFGMVVGYGTIAIYSLLGGMRAVIYTEIFKTTFLVLVVPMTCFAAGASMDVGSMIPTLPKTYTDLSLFNQNTMLLLGYILIGLMPICDAEMVQRYLMAKDSKDLGRAFALGAVAFAIFAGSILAIVYTVKVHAPAVPSADVILYFINNFLPSGIKGLMIAGLLAIVMSKAEATASATGIIIVRNLLPYIMPNLSEAQKLRAVRLAIISLLSISIFIVSYANSIADLILLLVNLWDPIILFPLIMGFIGLKTTAKTFAISTATAAVGIALGWAYMGELSSISYCTGLFGCMVGFYTAHHLQKLPSSNLIQIASAAFKAAVINYFKAVAKQFRKPSALKPKHFEFIALVFGTSVIHIVYMFCVSINYISIVMCISGFAISALFGLWKISLEQKMKPYSTKIWRCVATYCLPFTGTVLFLSNSGSFLQISGAMLIFALSFFVDSARFIICYTVGTLGAIAICWMHGIVLDPSFFFVTATVVFCALFVTRKHELAHEERIEDMHLLGGAIAHEVKNPLAALSMSAQTFSMFLDEAIKKKDGFLLSHETFEMMRDISNSIVKASGKGVQIVNTLLQTMRSDVSNDNQAKFMISEVIHEAIHDFNGVDSGLPMKINLEDDFEVQASRNNLRQVILNLLHNTRKHAGRVPIEITLSGRSMIYKDYGKGIPKEIIPYIFDKGFSTGSTGLGLSYSKMVMGGIGGKIECESEKDMHTTFTLKFNTH